MTYEEAKEQVAKTYGFNSWKGIDFYAIDLTTQPVQPPYAQERLINEAAELYAKSKWDEALELAARKADVEPDYLPAKDDLTYRVNTTSILSLKDKFQP